MNILSLRDFLNQHPLIKWNGDFYYQLDNSFISFEESYITLREKEARIRSDEDVRLLPITPTNHPHVTEWKIRSNSAQLFLGYLQKREIKTILEIGCGNGWFSNRIATTIDAEVCGVDVNSLELKQATRVFNQTKLIFLQADVLSGILPQNYFDVIVLPSSIQYFKNLPDLIKNLIKSLAERGEIHILDSPFYDNIEEVKVAQKRSELYFSKQGSAKMKLNYFHHCINDLKLFNWSFIFNPYSWRGRISRKLSSNTSPFPWIKIKAI